MCVAALAECHPPESLSACDGLADGSPCALGATDGLCDSGVCVVGECGDGVVSGAEDCEGSDLGDASCIALGFYEPAGLSCTSDCRFDSDACVGRCGDLMVNGPAGVEVCDGDPPAGVSCYESGGDLGRPSCSAGCRIDSSTCVRFGWRVVDVGAVGAMLGSHAAGGNDIHVVGAGEYSHYDGTRWTNSRDDSWSQTDVWADGSGSVFAIALPAALPQGATVLRRQPTGWDVEHALPPASGAAVAISGSAIDNVWAASAGAIARYDGTGWAAVTGWERAGFTVAAVEVLAADQAFVFLSDGSTGFAMRYSGSGFAPEPLAEAPTASLALATGEVFVGTASGTIYRDQGGAFVATRATGSSEPIVALSGSRPDRILAIARGQAQAELTGTAVPLLYDGRSWLPLEFEGSEIHTAVAGDGDRLYVAGDFGFVAEMFGGASAPALFPEDGVGSAVWTARAGQVFSIGRTSVGAGDLFQSYDGGVQVMTGFVADGHDIDGVLDPATGEAIAFAGGYRHIFRRDESGTTSTQTQSEFIPLLNETVYDSITALAAVDTDLAFGISGRFLYRITYDETDGQLAREFRDLSVGPTLWQAMAALSEDALYIGGNQGEIRRGNYVDPFAPFTPPLPGTPDGRAVTALWLTAETNIYVGTDRGELFQFDGDQWKLLLEVPFTRVAGIDGTAADDVFVLFGAAGGLTPLFHFDGVELSPVRVPNISRPTDVAVSETSIVIGSRDRRAPYVIARTYR